MSPFQETIDLPGDFVPEVKQQEVPLVNEKVKELGNEQYLKKLEFWKEQLEDVLSGEYEGDSIVTKKEEGIQNVVSKKSTFFVIDKNQPIPMLSRSLRDLLKESGFVESEGSVNFVYSKALEKDTKKKKGSFLPKFFQ